jgi:predicted secreted hydrolase
MILNELKEGQVCLLNEKQPLKVRVIENVGVKVKVEHITENGTTIFPSTYWENGTVEVLKVY